MAAVRSQLKAVPGVSDVKIDFDAKTAKVTMAEGTPTETLTAGLEDRFTAKVQ